MSAAGRATVTAASPADAALVHDLTQRAWHGTVAADSSAYRETVADVAALLERGGAFVLRLDDTPVGSVRWVPVPHAVPSWEIKRMGLLHAVRGRGLGRPLAGAVEAAARAAGIGRLQLGVRSDQPRLLGFWKDLGFEPDATVALSSHNPLTPPPTTLSRPLAPPAPSPPSPSSPPDRTR